MSLDRNLRRLARCDEPPRGRNPGRTISEALFGIKSMSNVPCQNCGQKLTMFKWDFPLEDGHDRSCKFHPRTEESVEWVKYCKSVGRKP